jgi:hypothetical protein
MTASFHTLSDLLFMNDPVIRCYIVWATDSVVKQIIGLHKWNEIDWQKEILIMDGTEYWALILEVDDDELS